MLSRIARLLTRAARNLPEALRRMGSPKAAAAGQHALYEIYSTLAAEGKLVERITRSHPERKLAKVAEEFEEMLKHPLARKYLRTKPELFISEMGTFLGGANASVKSERIVDVSRSLAEHLDERELKAVLGHELGHLIAGHMHPQEATFFAWARATMNQRRERMADQLGAMISGEGRALPGALKKVGALNEKSMQEVSANLPKPLRGWLTKKRPDTPSRAYPSLRQRAGIVNKVVDQMATPEGKGWAERVMASRIDALHDKLR
jgi:Zn-dependent protease with chaperone function